MGLSADPKWDLPKSAALGCGFLAGIAVGASVWKREEPVGIQMGQGKVVLPAPVHTIGGPRWTPELSWPIPGPFSAACLLQHVSQTASCPCAPFHTESFLLFLSSSPSDFSSTSHLCLT